MDDFTDFQNLDLESMSTEVLENFCDRYMEDALRVVNTGLIFSPDRDMCRLALAIVVGLYFKKLSEGVYSEERVHH